MRFPIRSRAWALLLLIAGASGLSAQTAIVPEELDGGAPEVVRPVEEAAAAAGVPLLEPVPLVNGFAPWFLPTAERLIAEAVAGGAAPGAAVVVGHRGKIVLTGGWGRTDPAPGAPAVDEHTRWDLASVTKVAATTIAAMVLVEDGALDLDAPVHRYLAAWPTEGERGRITVRDLLRHRAGLPAAAPVGRGGPDGLVERLAALPLATTPGADERYGDLAMVLLAEVLEAAADEPLDALLARRVYGPLGMTETGYRPLAAGAGLERIAPTELVRGELIHGVVHDPIARNLGGVAGNAGLFSSARDLATLASALLWEAPGRIVCRDVARVFAHPVEGARFALGWETDGALGPSSYGHVGYTGTSLWIDPENDLFVVLLTNRVNPSAKNQRHLQLRRALHDLVRRAVADVGPGAPPIDQHDGCVMDARVAEAIRLLPPVRWLH